MQSTESNRQCKIDQTNLDLSRVHLASDGMQINQLNNQINNQINNQLNSQISNQFTNSTINDLSNFNNAYSSPTTIDHLRQRSLGYNCITTNFNNGPISSSFVNQANFNYNNNKFNTFNNQVFFKNQNKSIKAAAA